MNSPCYILVVENSPAHAKLVKDALLAAGLDVAVVRAKKPEDLATLQTLLESLQHLQQEEQTSLVRAMHEIADQRLTTELESQVRDRTAELEAATRVLYRAQAR
jgi:CheY-like chemotaxis protein